MKSGHAPKTRLCLVRPESRSQRTPSAWGSTGRTFALSFTPIYLVRSRRTIKRLGELAEMAKHSNMMIVPDRPNDLSAVVATAMGLHSELSAKAKPNGTGAKTSGTAANATTPSDWASR